MTLLSLADCLSGFPGKRDDFKEGGGLPFVTVPVG